MYDPRYVLRSFDTLNPDQKMAILGSLLDALIFADTLYLQSNPSTPLIYEANLHYEPEEIGHDDWRDIPAVLDHSGGDCFPEGTLLLRDDFELVPIEKIRMGERIWGRDHWTTVEASVSKGVLSVDEIVLNNGSKVRLTAEHHAFVARCPKHAQTLDGGYGCSCPLSERQTERVRIRELRPKDVLITPQRLPFGQQWMDPSRAYVEGLFVADGWSDQASRFCISGQDGEVQRICERLGVATRWNRKYIAINSGEWTGRMRRMGGHAPDKHLLTVDLQPEVAAETLRGVMADSKANDSSGWTFTTTSRLLATQTRVLHKMFGRSCSSMFIEEHGGLGKNPFYRLGVRDPKSKGEKLLRVKSLAQDVTEAPCYDIQTSDHYVYLPEHDVTVSNCEDLACWRVAELRVRFGEAAQPYVTSQMLNSPEHGLFTLYHIRVRRADGTIEDPSKILGMP
jgi:hypothetical protein